MGRWNAVVERKVLETKITKGPLLWAAFDAVIFYRYYACGDNADNVPAVSHARSRVWGTEYTNSSLSEQQNNYYY